MFIVWFVLFVVIGVFIILSVSSKVWSVDPLWDTLDTQTKKQQRQNKIVDIFTLK